jgi:NADH-quinone oxidoreductase subunit C
MLIFFLKDLLKNFPSFFLVSNNTSLYIYIFFDFANVTVFLKFFKQYILIFCMLESLCCFDTLNKHSRFLLTYIFSSLENNFRYIFNILTNIGNNNLSASDLFPNSSWFEREIFELYGIIFVNHFNLRRLLTDYGFFGNPLRKDFPLSGFLSLNYNIQKNILFYEKNDLSQNFRYFSFRLK